MEMLAAPPRPLQKALGLGRGEGEGGSSEGRQARRARSSWGGSWNSMTRCDYANSRSDPLVPSVSSGNERLERYALGLRRCVPQRVPAQWLACSSPRAPSTRSDAQCPPQGDPVSPHPAPGGWTAAMAEVRGAGEEQDA